MSNTAPAGERLDDFIRANGMRKTWVAEQLDISPGRLHQLIGAPPGLPSLVLAWKIERFTKRGVKATDWVSQ